MKPFKNALRVWIGLVSFTSFLGLWALFAHTGKTAVVSTNPTTTSNLTALSTAYPSIPVVPTAIVSSGATTTTSSSSVQISVPTSQAVSSAPQIRTGGS